MKFTQHMGQADTWYSYERLSFLLQYYMPDVRALISATTSKGLQIQLNQINENGQYFIPLNINCLSQDFEEGKNNHWAGLYVVRNDGRITEVTYLDPMGKPISNILKNTITINLKVPKIGEPLLNRPVQYAEKEAEILLVGNTYDCGPMLVYALNCHICGFPLPPVNAKIESDSLGLYLRKAFNEETSFDEIYKTTQPISGEGLGNKRALNESVTELEKKLGWEFNTGACSSLSNPEGEKSKVLAQIDTAYTEGVKYYQSGNLELAEKEFVKALKPVLSKISMKSLYINVEEVKDKALDSMYHLGLIYLNNPNYFEHHAKAAGIFQYCAAFVTKYKIDTSIERFLEQAYDAEKEFLKSIGIDTANYNSSRAQIEDYKLGLESFRAEIKLNLDEINRLTVIEIERKTTIVEEIYKGCCNFFVNHQDKEKQGLVQKLLADCYKQLPPMPKGCQYAVIGLGSLALGTMTPWSDLEFAIIVNEDKAEYKEYLRNLAKLLKIKVTNLGETIIPTLGIESLNNFKTAKEADEWFWDDVVKRGFSFDGSNWEACKSPLGRHGYTITKRVKNENGVEQVITENKPDYELILTPEQLASFQQEKETGWFTSDKHLSQALKSVCLIAGTNEAQELLDQYRKLEKKATGKEISKSRALEILQEDINKFALKLSNEEAGKLLNVKKDIYRLTDRIIISLANYYDIAAEEGEISINVWDILTKVKALGKISEKGCQHLKEALGIATELRLNTYHNNFGQKEIISSYMPSVEHLGSETKRKIVEETFHLKDTSFLHYFYYVMLDMQELIKVFSNQEHSGRKQAEKKLQTSELFDDSNYTKGFVYERFLEYEEALNHMRTAEGEHPGDLRILKSLFYLYNKTGHVPETVSVAGKILKLEIEKHQRDPNHPDIADGYNDLGVAYEGMGRYEEAIKYHRCALNTKLKAYRDSPYHPDLARSYNNLGVAHSSIGQYEEAIEYYYQALFIKLQAYALSPMHPEIAGIYGNLGGAYRKKGEHTQAVEYFKKALSIYLKVYENTPNHPSIAGNLSNLGLSYSYLAEYDQALICHNQAEKILRVICRHNPDNPDVGTITHNIGVTYRKKGEYGEAIKCFSQALKIYLKCYEGSPNHPDIAVNYSDTGNVYLVKKEYDEAIEYFGLALSIYLTAYEANPNHPDIADTYNNLGAAYNAQEEHEEAIIYFKKALDIYLEAYKASPNHPNIAIVCNNLGTTYGITGLFDAALEMYCRGYDSNPSHPNAVGNLSRLGKTFYLRKEYAKAVQCGEKVLGLPPSAQNDNTDYGYLVMSYSNLGMLSYSNREYSEAIRYHEQTLKVALKAYQNPYHPHIALTYGNLASAYRANREYEKAIKYFEQSLEILRTFDIRQHCQQVAGICSNLAETYMSTREYGKAVACYEEVLKIFKNNVKGAHIAYIYNDLGLAYANNGEYTKAHFYVQQALKACSNPSNRQVLQKAIFLYNLTLMQLGNIALLEDKIEHARYYFGQVREEYKHMDLYSKEFVELQLSQEDLAYKTNILSAALNCQRVLVKIDPDLRYGNHYHNLGCFHACAGNIQEANEAFTKALTHPKAQVTGGLHVEYAQFLIINTTSLPSAAQETSKHLYAAIHSNNPGGLQYSKIEQSMVCGVLLDIIKQKNAPIKINPKVLAYYLLSTRPEYIKEDDSIETLLESFRHYCDSLQDEISFRLLSDADASIGNRKLALTHSQQSELIEPTGQNLLEINKEQFKDTQILESMIRHGIDQSVRHNKPISVSINLGTNQVTVLTINTQHGKVDFELVDPPSKMLGVDDREELILVLADIEFDLLETKKLDDLLGAAMQDFRE